MTINVIQSSASLGAEVKILQSFPGVAFHTGTFSYYQVTTD